MTETNSSIGATQDTAALFRPSEVSDQLGISGATLRRWSSRFTDFLFEGDNSAGGSHRRYSETDVAVLRRVQELLDEGMTYEQVTEQLTLDAEQGEDQTEQQADSDEDEMDWVMTQGESQEAQMENLPAAPLSPAALFVQEAVRNLTDTQQIILNSQNASRDLMGVMIQDNLNLKSENTDLRERMLESERDLSELRRSLSEYRERMETRVRVLEDAVSTLMANQRSATQSRPAQPPSAYPPYPAPPQQERRSFWSRLIGG